jgi:hypothetical protein
VKIEVRATNRVAHNDAMDPIVVALAVLVRDRWENERKARLARRRGLSVVERPE